MSSAARYFKNYKLDYPNADTNKASKKYVKAMKKLPVRLNALPSLTVTNIHRKQYPPTLTLIGNSSISYGEYSYMTPRSE